MLYFFLNILDSVVHLCGFEVRKRMNILMSGEGSFVAGDLCELSTLLAQCLNHCLLNAASWSGYTFQI